MCICVCMSACMHARVYACACMTLMCCTRGWETKSTGNKRCKENLQTAQNRRCVLVLAVKELCQQLCRFWWVWVSRNAISHCLSGIVFLKRVRPRFAWFFGFGSCHQPSPPSPHPSTPPLPPREQPRTRRGLQATAMSSCWLRTSCMRCWRTAAPERRLQSLTQPEHCETSSAKPTYMGLSQNRPPYIPHSTVLLVTGTPRRVPLFSEIPI